MNYYGMFIVCSYGLCNGIRYFILLLIGAICRDYNSPWTALSATGSGSDAHVSVAGVSLLLAFSGRQAAAGRH